jgi:hypothetical protein
MPKKKLAEATAGRLEDFSNVDLGLLAPTILGGSFSKFLLIKE